MECDQWANERGLIIVCGIAALFQSAYVSMVFGCWIPSEGGAVLLVFLVWTMGGEGVGDAKRCLMPLHVTTVPRRYEYE